MSNMVSPATGSTYGVERVCRVWNTPRSTYYAQSMLNRQSSSDTSDRQLLKRGPKTEISDSELLEHIHAAIQESAHTGEGYKKIHAALRFGDAKLHVGRNRILRIMRLNNLLSPYRVKKSSPNIHDRKIMTDEPNVMWGTDGTRVSTVDDGNVWVFSAVEHWNSECVGIYVCKYGYRFNAIQPILEGVKQLYGSVERGVAAGLTVRLDHGSANCSDYFQNEVSRLGITLSYSYVQQPQTNGVVERFNRTLKEQVIYGKVFQNLGELRQAVLQFRCNYNRSWRLKKLGYKSPLEARLSYQEQTAA